ncbi:MAG: glycosyltransferase family 39 protein [Candidatus Sedimenticola sp. (ex Thyasira tokunagai)]
MVERINPRLAFILTLVFITLYRILVIEGIDLQLFYDEAYYFWWSLKPDLGYYSKPPMVAWVIHFTTSLWGYSELAIKAGGLILYAAAATVVYAIGKTLYDEKVGALSGITFICLPVVGLETMFMSTDAPLFFFWGLTVWLFIKARDDSGWGWWLATGGAAGLGLLSKYSMGVLAIGLLVYLLTSPNYRRLLADRRLWVAVLLAALILSPNLYWNYLNDFISFRHTAEISQLDRELFHPVQLVEFLAGQFVVFGPLMMFFFFRHGLAPSAFSDDRQQLLLWPALAMLGVISLQALMSRAYPNWAAPAFVTATPFVVAMLVRRGAYRWLGAAIVINLLILSTIYHYHFIARTLDIELKRGKDPYSRMLGWRELSDKVSAVAENHPKARLTGRSRKLLANLGYYMKPQQLDPIAWNPGGRIGDQYQLASDITRFEDGEYLFVTMRPFSEGHRFRQAAFLGEQQVKVYSNLELRVYIYHLSGFRGYHD